MPKQHPTAHATTHQRNRLSSEEKHEHKQRVLTQGTPSITGSIADAIVVKNQNLFFLTDPSGIVPLGGHHGLGLYYQDCRYLCGYELQLAEARLLSMASTSELGYMASFQLVTPDIKMADGTLIRKEEVGVKWERLVDAARPALNELITLENFGSQKARFPLTLTFEADFEDVFAIRGLLLEERGRRRRPEWRNGALYFLYEGADKIYRRLSVHFSPEPGECSETSAHFDIRLHPGERQQLSVLLAITESRNAADIETEPDDRADFHRVKNRLECECDEWLEGETQIRSDSLLLGAILNRALRDLHALRSSIGERKYFAAGVPWFVTLFGRDSLITALQTLAFDPEIAAETLRLLAKYQSRQIDAWRDAQPGKILHELRIGEMATLGEIPHTPYYGTIDATPLFLILAGQHADWTGDLTLFDELHENIDLALEWMDHYGDFDQNGYIEYASRSEKGLVNQGWKDSGDAIVNVDGTLANPPIALVELQGYAYQAKRGIAALFRRSGD